MKDPIPGFDEYWLPMRQEHLNTPEEVNLILNMLGGLEPGARIFDAGCGQGRIANSLASMGYDVEGVDINPKLIEMASQGGNALFYVGDYLEHEPTEPFDAVISWYTSWGYDTPLKNMEFFHRCVEILKPGGKLLLQTWNPLALNAITQNLYKRDDGVIVGEFLNFDPHTLLLTMDRYVFSDKPERQIHQCETKTYPDLKLAMRTNGFVKVEPLGVTTDQPWQFVLGTAP